MAILNSYTPIGITVPITNGTNGYFNQSFDTNSSVKENLLNFLKTRRGERRMMPDFGTTLHSVVFEQNDENLREIVKNIITEELLIWIPEISILNINVINDKNIGVDDNYKIRISINFVIKRTRQTDSITFDLSKINI